MNQLNQNCNFKFYQICWVLNTLDEKTKSQRKVCCLMNNQLHLQKSRKPKHSKKLKVHQQIKASDFSQGFCLVFLFFPQTGLPVWGSYSFRRVASLGRMILPLSPGLHPTLGALGRMSLHLSSTCLPLWVPWAA